MSQDSGRPQINISKIVVGGGVAGAIFAIGSMLIFLTGLPMLRYFFLVAIVLGCAVALILRLSRRETPGTPWISAATGTTPDPASCENASPERPKDPPSITRLDTAQNPR